MSDIQRILNDHLAGNGTADDAIVNELYRQATGLGDLDDTDEEEVRAWAAHVDKHSD